MRINQINPVFTESEMSAVVETMKRGWITEGQEAERFCERLTDLVGTKYGCLAPNGTLALYLAIVASGLKPSDKIIIPSFTFAGSATAAIMAGLEVVYCDIDETALQISASHLNELIDQHGDIKAVMPVHIYGSCCDMDVIMKIARQNSLIVIEDAAQAIGVKYQGQHVGSFGDVGCFSFFADKTITTGEGAFIATNNPNFFEKLKYLRNQGRLDRGSFVHPEIGQNFRMTDLQCALGNCQLDRLDVIIEAKISSDEQYRRSLGGVADIRFFTSNPKANFVPFRTVIYSNKVLQIQRSLTEANIQFRGGFFPLHKQPFNSFHSDYTECAEFGCSVCKFPQSCGASFKSICLPVYEGISKDDIDYICDVIRTVHQ